MGADELIRSADIKTATGKSNWQITCLYPLEVKAMYKRYITDQQYYFY